MHSSIKKFDSVYSKNDSLPNDLLENFDINLIDLFKRGKEDFFQDIEKYFPKVFQFLIEEMSELLIVGHHGSSEVLYHWALCSDDFNVYSSIPMSWRKEKIKRIDRGYYDVLPEYLLPFYYGFDGFDFSNKGHLSLHESGFLLGFSNWYGMKNIIEYSAIGDEGRDDFINEFSRSDIRIILRQESGRVAFIDKSKTLEGVWTGIWGKLGEYQKVDNPIEFFNDCFFETVASFKKNHV